MSKWAKWVKSEGFCLLFYRSSYWYFHVYFMLFIVVVLISTAVYIFLVIERWEGRPHI